MLITCPDCTTSYEIDPGSLGEAGRTVRCTQCGATWRALTDGARADVQTDHLDLAGWQDAQPVDPVAEAGIEGLPAEAEYDDIEPLDDEDQDSAPQGLLFTPRRRIRQFGRPRFATMAATAGLALLLCFVAFRERAVALMPDLAGLYAAGGMPVNLRGLSFSGITTIETIENGIPLLVVSGTIENISDETVSVPRLRLAVRGSGGSEIFVWTAMPSQHELGAGEALPFWAQLASPPADGREIAVRFLRERDVALTARRQPR